jgi:hypothetical protein
MNKLYKSGLKFDKTLDLNISGCITRVNNKKASLVVIDGGVGEGKTTLATEIAQRIAFNLNQEFDISKQVKMGGREFLEGLQWCSKNGRRIIVYDEAGDFNTRASLTYFNQTLNRVFETYRALKIIVILSLPCFSDLDTSLMKKKISRFLVHTYGRNNKQGNYSVYSLPRMWYLKKNMSKATIPDSAFKKVAPNFRGHFLDLDTQDATTLENLSVKGKKNIVEKSALKEKGLMSIQEISEFTGYAVSSIRNFITARKFKGEKYGNTLYFNKSLVNALMFQKEKTGKVA